MASPSGLKRYIYTKIGKAEPYTHLGNSKEDAVCAAYGHAHTEAENGGWKEESEPSNAPAPVARHEVTNSWSHDESWTPDPGFWSVWGVVLIVEEEIK